MKLTVWLVDMLQNWEKDHFIENVVCRQKILVTCPLNMKLNHFQTSSSFCSVKEAMKILWQVSGFWSWRQMLCFPFRSMVNPEVSILIFPSQGERLRVYGSVWLISNLSFWEALKIHYHLPNGFLGRKWEIGV